MLKDQRVAKLKAALQTQYEQVFGSSAMPGDELDQARYRMGQVDKALAVIDSSHGHGKVLQTLSTFVKQLPAGTSVKVRELTVDGGTILMEAETTSFDAVEKLKQTFAASPQFEAASVTETRVGATPNQVVFRMTVTVQP
jgi:general secretion pathway protein L